MSTINLDLSQKVDLTCRQGDDFIFNIGATNEDGSALDFTGSGAFILMTIKDIKNNPIQLFSTEIRAHSDMNDLVYGFNHSILNLLTRFEYEKRAVAIQKITNSREINATAFTDIYHPKLTQQFNSLIGGFNAPFNVYTREHADKIWFSMNPSFANTTYTHTPVISYDDIAKKIAVTCDSVTFNLPLGKYKYDIKLISDLYCPVIFDTNQPIIEEAVYQSVTTIIFGSLDVKKD